MWISAWIRVLIRMATATWVKRRGDQWETHRRCYDTPVVAAPAASTLRAWHSKKRLRSCAGLRLRYGAAAGGHIYHACAYISQLLPAQFCYSVSNRLLLRTVTATSSVRRRQQSSAESRSAEQLMPSWLCNAAKCNTSRRRCCCATNAMSQELCGRADALTLLLLVCRSAVSAAASTITFGVAVLPNFRSITVKRLRHIGGYIIVLHVQRLHVLLPLFVQMTYLCWLQLRNALHRRNVVRVLRHKARVLDGLHLQ